MSDGQPTRRRGGWRRRAAVWVVAIAIGAGIGAGVVGVGMWVTRGVVVPWNAEVERFTDTTPVRSAHGVLLFPATDDVAILDGAGARFGTLRRAVIDHGPNDEGEPRTPADEVWIEGTRGAHRRVTPIASSRVARSELVFDVDEPRRGVLLEAMNGADGEVQTCVTEFGERDGTRVVRVDYREDCGCRGWAEYGIVPAGVVMRERGYFHHRDGLGTIVMGLLISVGAGLVVGACVVIVGVRFGSVRWGRGEITDHRAWSADQDEKKRESGER